jgi:nucleotide-binding universal stress UspA family protein
LSGSALFDVPFVDSVFHPSDFTEASANAFAHALAIALLRKTRFTILHAGSDYLAEDEWTKFPAVRATLERWGLQKPGRPRSEVFQDLSIRVKKVNVRSRSPLAATLDYLDKHATDLIVLATEGRVGLPRWIRPSVAERLAERSGTMTLFVPNATRGFVSLEDGEISLRRIVVPVDHDPSPEAAILYAARAAALMSDSRVAITLLHIGGAAEMPKLELPAGASCVFETSTRPGGIVEGILEAARESAADLIVMPTRGREGILDALRGSVTEQVLRRAECPLLAVPMR